VFLRNLQTDHRPRFPLEAFHLGSGGFISGDEVGVFDAIGSRPARPADIERVIDLGLAFGALPHVFCPRTKAFQVRIHK
jgi:hypothetical protein